MPSFLGPTNMPPMEARALNCPVLCSDHLGHKEQLGDGAIYFNPNSSDEIYDAMKRILDPEFRSSLLEKAENELEVTRFRSDKVMSILEDNLQEVATFMNDSN